MASGHVFRRDGARGPVWYAKYRLPSGAPGPEAARFCADVARAAAAGYFTKRLAQDWLDDILAPTRRNELPGMLATGATLATGSPKPSDHPPRAQRIQRATEDLTEKRATGTLRVSAEALEAPSVRSPCFDRVSAVDAELPGRSRLLRALSSI